MEEWPPKNDRSDESNIHRVVFPENKSFPNEGPTEKSPLEPPVDFGEYKFKKGAKEAGLGRLRRELKEKYKDADSEHIEQILASPEIKDSVEKIAHITLGYSKDSRKILSEWEERRKRLILGVIDPMPITNMIKKIRDFLKS